MQKCVMFGDEARQKLKKGVDLIANVIKTTLGPRGRNVIYSNHYGDPVISKDGVSCARQVECIDQTEQMGLMLIRQVAQKTADEAGDGTTTASLLAQSIFIEGLKILGTGANSILIKQGIDLAVSQALEFISRYVKKDLNKNDLLRVATISANNEDFLGKIICEAIEKVGKNGVITIEDNYRDTETYIETVEGMQLNEGYIHPYFVTDRMKMEAMYQNPYILMLDQELNNIFDITHIIELVIGKEGRPLVIFAHNISNQVIGGLLASRHKGGSPLLACKAPYFGDNRREQLVDLSILTGGRVISKQTGIDMTNIDLNDLGQADVVKATQHHTTITGGKGDKNDIKGRIQLLQTSIESAESDYTREKLQERLAKLTSGVAVIKVAATTEVELKERKMRVEDSLCACRAALEEGIIPGGGIMMLKASNYLRDLPANISEEGIGRKIIIEALRSPIKQMAENAGLNGSEIIANIMSWEGQSAPYPEANYGFNFLTNEYGDLIELGIIDPFKVVRLSLENAASVAGMLLSSEVTINEVEELELSRTPKPKGS